MIAIGDLVNIDVSAVKDGFFGDTGSSFAVGKADAKTQRLVRDGKRALWVGLSQVKTGGRLAPSARRSAPSPARTATR